MNNNQSQSCQQQLNISTTARSRNGNKGRLGRKRQSKAWDVVEGLRSGQRFVTQPASHEGYLWIRRKWPLKGWRKRFCRVEGGILKISKNLLELEKGRVRNSIDIAMSVICYRSSDRQIDIDADDYIYHFKVKDANELLIWIAQLREHRLYRQDEIAYGQKQKIENTINDEICITNSNGEPFAQGDVSLESFNKAISVADSLFLELDSLLQSMEKMNSSSQETSLHNSEVTNKAVSGKSRWLPKRNKRKSRDCSKLEGCINHDDDKLLRVSSPVKCSTLSSSSSSPDFISLGLSGLDISPVSSGVLSNDSQSSVCRTTTCNGVSVREDYLRLACETRTVLKMLFKIVTENRPQDSFGGSKKALAMHLSGDYHSDSYLHAGEGGLTMSKKINDAECLNVPAATSYFSMVSEYFDARSEFSGTGSELSSISGSEDEVESFAGESEDENNETGIVYVIESEDVYEESPIQTTLFTDSGIWVRRDCLPCPMPQGGLSLWNILCKNIGKDLSKVSMPVVIHEPLSALQVLCEELEYSELLDKAAETDDPVERMVLVSTFAVSRYAATSFRAERKPFNPLLGETFECIRDDKGFRFVAEQVSHHPPISACYTDSPRGWTWWQDARVRIRFWGKSMEVQPQGIVHLELNKFGEHYTFNKVTTCVHNLLSGRRWVDQYGEMIVKCSSGSSCKLVFEKANNWSGRRHELSGNIYDAFGVSVQTIFGKWTESIHVGKPPTAKCVWRPGAMSTDSEHYYGFTRFAMELNELSDELKECLPPTDSRLRPDQRLLEDGLIDEADQKKSELEIKQRERRLSREQKTVEFCPLWFHESDVCEDDQKQWVFGGTYWPARVQKFQNIHSFEQLW